MDLKNEPASTVIDDKARSREKDRTENLDSLKSRRLLHRGTKCEAGTESGRDNCEEVDYMKH